MTATRKDLRIERRFLPSSLDQAEQLREVIRRSIEAGEVEEVNPRYAESMADSITGWLIGKRSGIDGLTAPTRSRYRRILSHLEDRAGGPEGGRGRGGIALVLGGGSAAAGLALAGGPIGAVVALAMAPIIYETPVEEPGEELAA